MTRAMVVLSGGQDSTTCLFWAKRVFDEVHAVTFGYGQRHKREIGAASYIATLAGVASHEVVYLDDVLRSRSPLVDHKQELETYPDFDTMDRVIGSRVELTFVPMRNSLFLTVAANRAVARDIFDLVTGVCEEDNANYPDCRGAFIDLQQRTIASALGLPADGFRIHTPLISMTKAQSVKLAMDTPGCFDALAYSHTCYEGGYPPCGKCHACVLRAHGFEEAGVEDPLLHRVAKERAIA